MSGWRLILLILCTAVVSVRGSFVLEFRVLSISNPQGLCADTSCNPGCPAGSCQYVFQLSMQVKGADTPISLTREPDSEFTLQQPDSGTVSEGAITSTLGVDYTFPLWPQGGGLVFFDLLFETSGVVLVDRFAVNITSVPDGSTTVQSHLGIFGLASVDTSSTLMCSSQFTGPICTICLSSGCTCAVGFTGPMCATSIDDCAGVDCGENQRCVDDHVGHTCECEAGFTGADCLTDIDECASVDCHNGVCTNEVGSFHCNCSSGFTGSLCDTSTDSDMSTATDSEPALTTPNTTTHSTTAELSNSEQSTLTTVVLIVVVSLLLVIVVIIVVGFSLAIFFKGRKGRSKETGPANTRDTAPNSVNLEPNRAVQISSADNTADPHYDYPHTYLESTLYMNNTLARAQVNNVIVNVSLKPCPAYASVADKDCVPCPAYAATGGTAESNLDESDDHTYY